MYGKRGFATLGGMISHTPKAVNDPILGYLKGSAERAALQAAIADLKANPVDVPLVIGDREVRTRRTLPIPCPHDHRVVLGEYHVAGEAEVKMAIEAAMEAHKSWSRLDVDERLATFLKAAALLRGPYRARLNAATVLGQSKNFYQAEIDAACELIDFWTYNVSYAKEIYAMQPQTSLQDGIWNRQEWRPLEGFVYAVTPFNFTAIAGNLASAPAMLGNVCVWKPSDSSILSNYILTEIYRDAGLPAGVINFVPADPVVATQTVLADRNLAGIHFTGSTHVFRSLFHRVAERMDSYRNMPRIVGETGGKDFVFVHPETTDVDGVATALVRGAFEFCGQKCSAASRAYVPRSLWPLVLEKVRAMLQDMKLGNPEDPATGLGAVIHERSFNNAKSYIDHAKQNPDSHRIVAGGTCDREVGWFVQPTVVETTDPRSKLIREEIFAPILTVYVFEDDQVERTLDLVDDCDYALTGAVWARDRATIAHLTERLAYAAGNFYINDKPTGSVVGQQPFGGSRASGTNDKAGSILNLLRWVSPRAIKETFVPPKHFAYPYMNH